jgi:hydrogenase/urease accessory protein HupE
MKYLTTTGLAALAVLGTASTAHAHEGDHSAGIVANVIHWLSSPTHSLFAVLGGMVVGGAIVYMARKKKA